MGDNCRVPVPVDDEVFGSTDRPGADGSGSVEGSTWAGVLTRERENVPGEQTDPRDAASGDAGESPVTTGAAGEAAGPLGAPSGVSLETGLPDGEASERVPDAICLAAVTQARQGALEVAGPGQIGAHIGAVADDDRVVSHLFESLAPGYHGWRWSVTVARVPRGRAVTVSEVVLLPGPQSVLAPDWLPWAERIAPGDLGPADQLAYRDDDDNLEPGYLETGDDDEDRMANWELGLGRPRVLSPLGRTRLARRWYGSDRGPVSDEAVHARAACSTCGYFLSLAGSMRLMFGACGNEWSPSDGKVVSADHGCGAHSETDLEPVEPEPLSDLILDESGFEAIVLPPPLPRAWHPAEQTESSGDAVQAPEDSTQEEPARIDGVEPGEALVLNDPDA